MVNNQIPLKFSMLLIIRDSQTIPAWLPEEKGSGMETLLG
jgi:hypothetical protein